MIRFIVENWDEKKIAPRWTSFVDTSIPPEMRGDTIWSWFPGTVDIQAICLALPRGKRNFMVGFICPRPIATRRTCHDGSVSPGKGISLPWSLHGFLILCSSVLEKKNALFNVHRFFDDSRVRRFGENAPRNWQLACNCYSANMWTRIVVECTQLIADRERFLVWIFLYSFKKRSWKYIRK